jgi:hypothetical protein
VKPTKRKGFALLALAAIFTGGEALVAAGVPLPFSNDIPGWARALLILAVTMGAFVLRVLAQRREEQA